MNESPPRKQDDSESLSDDIVDANSDDRGLEESSQSEVPVNESTNRQVPEADSPSSDVAPSDELPMDEKLDSLAEQVGASKVLDSPVRKSRGAYLAFALLFLLFLLGFGALAYYAFLLEKRVDKIALRESTAGQIQGLSQGIDRNTKLIADKAKSIEANSITFQKRLMGQLESSIAQASKDFRVLSTQSQQQVDMLQQRIDGHQQRLLSLSTTSREDWLLAEAEYLLKLANQRILLERTTENAVALLESADELVAQVSSGTGDVELFAIRKAMTRDLTALKLIEPIDRDGVYLKLQALAERVDELPRLSGHGLLGPSMGAEADTKNNFEDASSGLEGVSSRLWSELKSIAGSLNQYVKIQNVSAPINPLVDEHFAQVAGLNVRLLIEQAQIALLKESEVIYSTSLSDAIELIAQYYIPSKSAKEFQASLSDLSEVTVAPTLPDISQSLQLLHAYIRQLHKIQGSDEGAK